MWKFDTRDKKPKLWNLLVLSVITAGIVGALILSGAEAHALAVCVLLDVYLVLVLLLLANAWVGQLQYNPYSYNTILYAGFALFDLSVLLTFVILTVRMILYPEVYHGMMILSVLLDSAKSYMWISFPFIAVFSAALCISNISLIRHEGKRFVNVLGIILSFLLVAGALLLYRLDYYVSGSQAEVMRYEIFTNLYASVYLYFECMLIGVIAANIIAVYYEPEPDKDFLIILGCGIRKDGTPSPLLRGRIDRAIAFARRQKEETGKDLIFVPSGGQGPNEVISEAESMRRYLLSQGIPEERIRVEDRSTTTFENMKFSKAIIEAVNPNGKVAFATTNYHVFRSGLFARRVKMRAVGMGARTKWYFWPNAAVREFVGLLTKHKLKQTLVFCGMLLFYLVLTVLMYR